MKLYLMRHGETDGNRARALQGRMDNPLNEMGRRQAEQAAEEWKDVHFDACYVSPLTRAIQTAEIVTGKDRSSFMIEERIVEISFGSDEGKTLEELGPGFQKFFLDPEHYAEAAGAESFSDLLERTGAFLEDLKHAPYENVLAVSHGAAIHAMLLLIEGGTLADFWKLDVGNCGITVIELDNLKWKIVQPCQTRDSFYGKGKLG